MKHFVIVSNGSIQLSLFDNDALMSTQNLRLGVLRLQEMLTHLNAGRDQMEALVDELANAQLATYKKLYLKDREIQNIIICHAKEGEGRPQRIEGVFIHQADFATFNPAVMKEKGQLIL